MLNQNQIEKKYKRELDRKKNEHNIFQAENIKSSKVFDNFSSEISLDNKENNSKIHLGNEGYSNHERTYKKKLELSKKNKKLVLEKKAKQKLKKEGVDKIKKAVGNKIWAFITPHLVYIIPILLGIIFLFFIFLYIASIFEIGRNYDDYSEDEKASLQEVKDDYDSDFKDDYDSEYWKDE
jgi:Fe2+ transport system protein B